MASSFAIGLLVGCALTLGAVALLARALNRPFSRQPW